MQWFVQLWEYAPFRTMVLTIYGNSERVAHVWSNVDSLICLRHSQSSILVLFKKSLVFLHMSAAKCWATIYYKCHGSVYIFLRWKKYKGTKTYNIIFTQGPWEPSLLTPKSSFEIELKCFYYHLISFFFKLIYNQYDYLTN